MSNDPGFTADDVYQSAITQLAVLVDKDIITSSNYELLRTGNAERLIAHVAETIETREKKKLEERGRLQKAVEGLFENLNRYSGPIDMVVQSSPQVMGLSLAGLIWGGLKFFVVVRYSFVLMLRLIQIRADG